MSEEKEKLKTRIENMIQRSVEKVDFLNESTYQFKIYKATTPQTSELLPKRTWIVYEHSGGIICVPEGASVFPDSARVKNNE